ncbi:MAG: hypothetical protein ACKPKO_31000, partial [Candidatus Fonsibacter sp.]
DIIDFTTEGLTYICKQAFKPPRFRNKNDLSTYRILYIYIYMETTTEPINEDATTKQNTVEELKKYNRDYDHAHKKASDCEHCKKAFSSVSALRRHQGKTTQM